MVSFLQTNKQPYLTPNFVASREFELTQDKWKNQLDLVLVTVDINGLNIHILCTI